MGEPTLSNQRETTFQACPTKPRRFGGRKAALLLSLAAVCAVVLFIAFLPWTTTPPQTSFAEQKTHRASRTSPQEQALLHDIVQEMIAEGKLTPYPPGSPEAQQAKSAAPMTPAERVKHYEDAVTNLLN